MCIFHKWSKWEDVETGDVLLTHADGNRKKIGKWLIQNRTCEKCGKKELREESTY